MRIEILRQVDLFQALDEPVLTSLAQEFVEIFVPAEHPVIQEGVPVDAFYIVTEGEVVVYRDTVGKPVQLLTRVGAREFFGEFGLFTQAESSISARTTVPSRILKIGKQVLLDLLDDQPGIILKLQMAAAKRHTINAAAALELGQRSEVRIRVNRRVVLTLGDGRSRSATLDNLSPGGLALKGGPPEWRPGDEVDFDLRCGEEVLCCEGRITWVRGDLAGFAFTDTSEDHDILIQRSLRRMLGSARPDAGRA